MQACFERYELVFTDAHGRYTYLLYCFETRHELKGFHRTPSPDISEKAFQVRYNSITSSKQKETNCCRISKTIKVTFSWKILEPYA